MARTTSSDTGAAFDSAGAVITQTPLQDEVSSSYLEYAYSVIHSRALPDARDGLKPVHRRILYGMSEAGLRPDHAYVKSARVVGDVMGRYHPHGDSAIYDALVRLAQPFATATPLIDGHGNFGSPNDPPAAMRYTECRLSHEAMLMVRELHEDTVTMGLNYDGSLKEPEVLPAAFPYLLVNGSTGIAVGMATNMIPHNLGEVVDATRMLLKKPKATLDELMTVLPGPDLPTGGSIIGLDQVRAAYETGKGSVRLRAHVEIEPAGRGRQSLVVTSLPYGVGTEKVIEHVKTEIGKKRLAGVADIKDLSDRTNGLRLVIECKSGVNPKALLAELYRYTPLETSFGIANLALVDGKPQLLPLKQLLEVFLTHRMDVVTRRTQFRLAKAEARLHIVEGLLIALDNIDKVVKLIRASKDTAVAKTELQKRFKLSEVQATHILDMPLRRLVALEVENLRKEQSALEKEIAGYQKILGSDKELRAVVDKELASVRDEFAVPRRSVLIGEDDSPAEIAASTGPITIPDEPCTLVLSSSGILARTAVTGDHVTEPKRRSARTRHDTTISHAPVTSRAEAFAITNRGRAIRMSVLDVPAVPRSGVISCRGGVSAREVVDLQTGEYLVAVCPATTDGVLYLGTRNGIVKAVQPEWPSRGADFPVIALKDDDTIVGGAWVGASEDHDVVFVTDAGSLLRFPASGVRPQGRAGGGVAGVKLAAGTHVVGFTLPRPSENPILVTCTNESAKITPLAEYPRKGRATGGVRCQRFTRGETALTVAWAGVNPGASSRNGSPVMLPSEQGKRDGSGAPVKDVAVVGQLLELPNN